MFENIHKTKTYAFIDGVLITAIFAGIYHFAYRANQKQTLESTKARANKAKWSKYHQGHVDGWNGAHDHLHPYVDLDHYNTLYGPYYKTDAYKD